MANNLKADQDEEKKASAKRKASTSNVSQDTACNGANPKVGSPVTRRKIFATNNQTTNKPSPAVLALQQMDDALAEKVNNQMCIKLSAGQHFSYHDCQLFKQEMPSVICSKSTLQLRAVSIKDETGKVIETQWRVVVEHISRPDSCLDADIGMVLTHCQACVWETLGPQVKVRDLSITESALILRQEYFTTRRNGLAYFPKTITVSGRVYSLHRCQQETTYCYAVPYCESDGDFVFAAKTGSDAKYLIKISKAPMYGYRYHGTFEPKVNLVRGECIVATKYGEVYRAFLHTKLPTATTEDAYTPNTYDTASSVQVAAKIVRHLNDHCGEVERVYCEDVIGAVKRYNRQPNHHLGSEGLDAPLNGTSVREWPVLSPAQAENFIALRIPTIEDVAAMTEDAMRHFGMGGRELKEKAIQWMTGQDAAAQAMQENATLKEQLAELKAQVAELKAAAEPKRRKKAEQDAPETVE